MSPNLAWTINNKQYTNGRGIICVDEHGINTKCQCTQIESCNVNAKPFSHSYVAHHDPFISNQCCYKLRERLVKDSISFLTAHHGLPVGLFAHSHPVALPHHCRLFSAGRPEPSSRTASGYPLGRGHASGIVFASTPRSSQTNLARV
jgi:hypothetical protein